MACAGRVSKRQVLWCMVLAGCAVNYMVRTNLNIALVVMVKSASAGNNNNSQYLEASIESGNVTNNTGMAILSEGEPQYDWNENEQSQMLGAFFWTYWIGQLGSGIYTHKYGTKMVFGLSNLFLCVTSILIPLCASISINVLLTLRVLQGLVGGLVWPSLGDLTAKWIPPTERSKFVTAYMGSSIGTALTYPLCGVIIHSLGWRAVFYVTGTIGMVWFAVWWKFVYNSPAEHPHITEKELQYIQNSLGDTVSQKKLPTPWKKIILSPALWILVAAHWGCLWIMFTLLTQGPTYFQTIHNCSIRLTGILSGIPHISRLIIAMSSSYLCDYLLSKNYSFTAVRKVGITLCSTIQGVFTVGLAFSGFNTAAAITCFTAATSLSGAEAPGLLASYCDLSPNFASAVMGVGNMVAVMTGIFSPIMIGALTYQNQTAEAWQLVFLISGAMAIVPGLFYLWKGDSEVQSWNDSETSSKKELHDFDFKHHQEELEKLKS